MAWLYLVIGRALFTCSCSEADGVMYSYYKITCISKVCSNSQPHLGGGLPAKCKQSVVIQSKNLNNVVIVCSKTRSALS